MVRPTNARTHTKHKTLPELLSPFSLSTGGMCGDCVVCGRRVAAVVVHKLLVTVRACVRVICAHSKVDCLWSGLKGNWMQLSRSQHGYPIAHLFYRFQQKHISLVNSSGGQPPVGTAAAPVAVILVEQATVSGGESEK